ncbi:MAG: hypothetical protein ABL926_14335, partial [Novosphingobium sp.]|uniref:hypothetical protein n=1 Tax=Novosphingobium sp. TaxID=1874826 RepID=UPI0032B736D7
MLASGEDAENSKVAMGVSGMPKGTAFNEGYVAYLRAKTGLLTWLVPANEPGKIYTAKFCANAYVGGAADKSVRSRDVSVEVLPALTPAPTPNPTVAANTITGLIYNASLKQLEISGQVGWTRDSTQADREAAIMDPVNISDAETGSALGTVKAVLNGRWSVVIPSASAPRAVDAIFQGAVSTELLQQHSTKPSKDDD